MKPALRQRFDGGLDGFRVGVLGLAFKPETDDVRAAASLDLIGALVTEGAEVVTFDPQAMPAARSRLPATVRFVGSVAEAADRARALVLLTEWRRIVDAD